MLLLDADLATAHQSLLLGTLQTFAEGRLDHTGGLDIVRVFQAGLRGEGAHLSLARYRHYITAGDGRELHGRRHAALRRPYEAHPHLAD